MGENRTGYRTETLFNIPVNGKQICESLNENKLLCVLFDISYIVRQGKLNTYEFS
jgi:hypothetical protein